MRKMFVILGLFTLALLVSADDASARGGRGGGGGSCGGGGSSCYSGSCYAPQVQCHGGSCYAPGHYHSGVYQPGASHAYSQFPSTDSRQSFYFNPASQAATINILLPQQDAEIWFNGAATQQRGMERVFHTPALEADGSYLVKARWMQNGKAVTSERKVMVRAGQVQSIDFRAEPREQLGTPKAQPDEDR